MLQQPSDRVDIAAREPGTALTCHDASSTWLDINELYLNDGVVVCLAAFLLWASPLMLFGICLFLGLFLILLSRTITHSDASSTRYGDSILWRVPASSLPMDTQVSVTTQSTPSTASSGSFVNKTVAPSDFAQSMASCGGASSGGQGCGGGRR